MIQLRTLPSPFGLSGQSYLQEFSRISRQSIFVRFGRQYCVWASRATGIAYWITSRCRYLLSKVIDIVALLYVFNKFFAAVLGRSPKTEQVYNWL